MTLKRLHLRSHTDPFYGKKEFAPSDKNATLKRQEASHNLIAPHLRVLQFLISHFNATRLGNPHTQRIFHRLIIITLECLKDSASHPLAREIHFRIILFGLDILKFCTVLDQAARWRLKDAILSAALTWFSYPPRYESLPHAPPYVTLIVVGGHLEATDCKSKRRLA